MLKKHLRQIHGFECVQEDKYQPLRDSRNGTSTCRHCFRSFVNMYVLKDHINKYACDKFDAAQGTVTPISARAELRIHLRHQSFQGLLLDQSLYAELSSRCAFCHTQVAARAMRPHYTEAHRELLPVGKPHQDRIQDAANFGSGLSVCQTRTQKAQSHQSAVTFQIAILYGHIMQPEQYPIMPMNKRPWSTAFPTQDTSDVHHPALETDLIHQSSRPNPAEVRLNSTQVTASALHRCPHCSNSFLSAQGFQSHVKQIHGITTDTLIADLILSNSEPINSGHKQTRQPTHPSTDSLAQILRMSPQGPVAAPAATYKCPLCQGYIGRKALAAHLRIRHDFERPAEMDFHPARDVLPGRLACAHCRAIFSMDFALKTLFKRTSCPIRLGQIARNLHFGAPIPPPVTEIDIFTIDEPGSKSPSKWTFDLMGPTMQYIPHCPASLSLVTPMVLPLCKSWSFAPEVCLHWFQDTLTWIIHWPALPQVCLPMIWLC